MEVTNHMGPDAAQMAGFTEGTKDGPIYMVNLLKYRDKAEYADGRDTNLSGREAYGLYTQGVRELLKTFGGSFMFSADVERLMLGEVEELWDMVAIAMYPSRKDMLAMISSPEYQAIAIHRTAGLAGQLNIETVNSMGLWSKQGGNS